MSKSESTAILAHWFRQWRRPLHKFLLGRGAVPACELDDVAQEVFLRLLRYERTELIEHPQAYLYKMAGNVAAEWALRGRLSRPHASQWLENLAAPERAEDVTAQQTLQNEIERALLTLTTQQRAVLRLQFFENLSRAQIAERLGLTERSVKRVLMKGYEKLRRQLNVQLLRDLSDGCE